MSGAAAVSASWMEPTVTDEPMLLLHHADLGPTLRALRKAAGMRLVDVAAASGLHSTDISLIERGARQPGPEKLLKILAALGRSIALVRTRPPVGQPPR